MKRFHTVLSLMLTTTFLAGCGGSGSHLPPDVSPDLLKAEGIRAMLRVAGTDHKKAVVAIVWGGEFAALTGTISLKGKTPTNRALTVDKDLAICKPSGAPVMNKIVTVGPNKGLANVLVYADVPKEWCHESMIGNTDTVDFDQKNCLFVNRIFPMQTTQTLRLLNSDTVGHNAALKPVKNMEFNNTIAGGGEAIYPPGGGTLKQEKMPFSVSCAVHTWMQSYMIIRANGYFAVTGEDGSFTLPNLPAGVPVKVTVWHEATKGIPKKAVSVEPTGIAERWNKRGTFTVNLKPDSPETVLNVAVNSSALSK